MKYESRLHALVYKITYVCMWASLIYIWKQTKIIGGHNLSYSAKGLSGNKNPGRKINFEAIFVNWIMLSIVDVVGKTIIGWLPFSTNFSDNPFPQLDKFF